MFDIAIKNGLVYTGENTPPTITNIYIKGSRIAYIGKEEKDSFRVIDATGKVVAPGFIDPHTHNDNNILHDKQNSPAITQGVTTQIGGMCGLGMVPCKKEDIPQILRMYSGIVGRKNNFKYEYTNAKEYLELADGAAINFAIAINHSALRVFASGFYSKPYEEIAGIMKDELTKNLKMGAIGLSIGLDYFPAHTDNVDTHEIIDLSKVVASEDALMMAHVRPSGKGIDAMEEMDIVARESKVKLHILHTKTFHPSSSGHPEYITDRFDKANAEGASVTMEFYPYSGWETLGLYFVPFWTMEGGCDSLISKLSDPTLRTQLVKEIGDNYVYLMGDDAPAICSYAQGHPEYEGKTFDEICKLRNQDMGEMILDLLVETDLGLGALSSEIKDPKIYKLLQDDYMTLFKSEYYTVSSDSIVCGGFPHPRVFGSFAKMIRLTREYNYPLEHTIYKMTKFQSDRFMLEDRGEIAIDKFADIAIFDYEKVTDCANYEISRAPAKGFEYVLVNGQVALENGIPNGVFNGMALKRKGC